MFFQDLTLFKSAFKGFDGDVWDLKEEVKKRWCGDVSAEEFEGEDAELDGITLYDYHWYGPSDELLEFCGAHGVDLQEQWNKQCDFDKVAREAMMSVW